MRHRDVIAILIGGVPNMSFLLTVLIVPQPIWDLNWNVIRDYNITALGFLLVPGLIDYINRKRRKG